MSVLNIVNNNNNNNNNNTNTNTNTNMNMNTNGRRRRDLGLFPFALEKNIQEAIQELPDFSKILDTGEQLGTFSPSQLSLTTVCKHFRISAGFKSARSLIKGRIEGKIVNLSILHCKTKVSDIPVPSLAARRP